MATSLCGVHHLEHCSWAQTCPDDVSNALGSIDVVKLNLSSFFLLDLGVYKRVCRKRVVCESGRVGIGNHGEFKQERGHKFSDLKVATQKDQDRYIAVKAFTQV